VVVERRDERLDEGHDELAWTDRVKVEEYLGRISEQPQRVPGEALLLEHLPPTPRRVLDLGCGDGRIAALVLAARSSVRSAVAIDRSAPMLERARARFAGDPRVEVLLGDLDEPLKVEGPFDAVVSGLAIHHLDDRRKVAILDEIVERLSPGGVYANFEVVASATPELHLAFRRSIGREADDPEDRLVPVDTQLEWMRAAGLEQVDCLWRWRGFALLVGTAPPATDH
jgi:SAM-dependent methyltransferase